MAKAAQEGIRPGLPLLEYGELVDLDRFKKYGLSPILDPREIPVHPKIFQSPEVYTPEFAREVWESVPDSIRADVAAIEAKTGVPVPVRVSNWGVSETTERMGWREREPYLGFFVQADPEGKAIWVEPRRGIGEVNAINLGLSESHHYLQSEFVNRARSITKTKYDLYTTPETANREAGVITWYSHNVGMSSLPLLLILRNFAIMFNNLGFQRVGAV